MKLFARMLLICLLVIQTPIAMAANNDNNNDSNDNVVQSVLFLPKADQAQNTEDLPSMFNMPLDFSGKSYELGKKFNLSVQEGRSEDDTGIGTDRPEGWMNPGRATILSAIIPGAGEFYADSPLKGAFFLAFEVFLWTGVVSYAAKGKDKTKEFEAYASDGWNDTGWRDDVYQRYELYLALNDDTDPWEPDLVNPVYDDLWDAWKSLTWEEKSHHLPDNFTHELPEIPNQQYFEMIGKYLTQFGIGWDSDIPTNLSEYDAWFAGYSAKIDVMWNQDSDDFIGFPVHVNQYIGMRADANKLLDASANYMMVVMVNHVVSAMDAGFTVRLNNRKLAEAQFGMALPVMNGEVVTMGGINFKF